MVIKFKKLINLIISKIFRLIPKESNLLKTYKAFSMEEKLSLRIPFSNLKLINFLISYSKENIDLAIFEYGSGSSTLFFEDHFSNIYSVEHDETWYKIISQYKKNAEVYFVPPLKSKLPRAKSLKRGYKNLDFSDYVDFIKKLDMNFDIIFIDGRAREECLKVAKNYLKPNGLIILDDSSRRRYKRQIAKLFPNSKIIHFKGLGTFIPLLHKASIIF